MFKTELVSSQGPVKAISIPWFVISVFFVPLAATHPEIKTDPPSWQQLNSWQSVY